MITIEMLTAAVYGFMGLAALVVALTQVFKNWFANADWYKKVKSEGKKWADHMFAFIASFLCNAAVLGVGLYFGVGIFAAFCLTCLSSWLLFIGSFICCGFVANGQWSYEFMQKVLEWIKLLPTPTKKDAFTQLVDSGRVDPEHLEKINEALNNVHNDSEVHHDAASESEER